MSVGNAGRSVRSRCSSPAQSRLGKGTSPVIILKHHVHGNLCLIFYHCEVQNILIYALSLDPILNATALPWNLYSPDHVAGAGGGPDPSEISFPGCSCQSASCLTSACSCLHYGANYSNSCIKSQGNALEYSNPVFECNTMCQCGELCQNRVVQRGLQFRLEVFKTAKKGWGLRTLEPIPKGRFVCEYAGEILDFKEAFRRTQLQTSNDPNYIIAIREHMSDKQIMETFVDPTFVGNVGRFLNHSCEPNLFMVPVRIDSMVPKLALFAACDICEEEELSYDYSGRYCNYLPMKDLQPANKESKKPCYCGTKLCTGFLPYDGSIFHKNGVETGAKGTL